SGIKCCVKITVIGNMPQANQFGGVNPRDSSQPIPPPTSRFLNSVVQASANVQAGSMYGISSAVENHRRPNKSVRAISHAAGTPMASAPTIDITATARVFNTGRQKIIGETVSAKTRWK